MSIPGPARGCLCCLPVARATNTSYTAAELLAGPLVGLPVGYPGGLVLVDPGCGCLLALLLVDLVVLEDGHRR